MIAPDMPSPPLSTDLERLLVSTKFAPPRIGSRYIMRTHLLSALGRDRRRRLTLVTGSAGFGKTILLAQWRQELMAAGAQVAWLSLHADEKLLPNFRTHLIAALGRLGMALSDELLFAADDRSHADDMVAAINNNIADTRGDLYLILDDYHHVEDPRAHQLVQKLLDEGPGNLHLVIASRALPPLSVARLRALEEVAEIECGELPFDRAETREFLEQNVTSVKLDSEEVGLIHDHTNGWPASLQLVSIMLKNRPEGRSSLPDLARQSSDLQNYLWEDVVGDLPAEVTAFMESLSIARRFNASLAEAITGRGDAAALIDRIEEENLLIMRAESDARAAWFRFHPLFNEFLSARLARRGASEVAECHRRASRWFAKRRFVVEAVRHATLAGDIDEAVDIIEQAVPGSWKLSYLGPLLHLVDNLSLDAIATHPRILYLGSLTLSMTGASTRANAWLNRLGECAVANAPAFAFRIALIKASMALQQDDSTRCLDHLEPFEPSDAGTAFERYVYLMARVACLAGAGRLDDALRLHDLNPIPPEDADDDLAMRATGSRTFALLVAGHIREAEPVSDFNYARAVAIHGRASTCANLSAATRSVICYERNRIDDARELLAKRQNNRQTSAPQMMIWATLCRVRLDHLQESAEAALALLERQKGYFRSLGLDRGTAYLGAEQVRILLADGQFQTAQAIAAQLDTMATAAAASRASFAAEIPIVIGLAHARLDMARDDNEAALRGAEAMREAAAASGRKQLEITAALIAVLALEKSGRRADALAHLAATVALGGRLGFVRTFLDEGPVLLMLLRELAALAAPGATPPSHAAELVRQASVGSASGGAAEGPATTTDTLLTGREVEIVELVAAGMSNKRIALTLGISVETVKWNLKNIFTKLGVSSRYDAMVWARRQGLID
ncbi:MAG: LuxR C-terminal-related transcriptional regulator [Sphingopyxis sp.]|uniref:helix-turn-helix transcriptional regulator n=1 Tax=Sphingopyxis sp. TaxID=1908224 RepID=UPI003D6DA19A